MPGSTSPFHSTRTMNVSRNQLDLVVQRNRSPCLQSPEQPATFKAGAIYDVGQNLDDEHSKQRHIRAILNKLTPQNFDKLFEQIKGIQIETAATLTGVIGQIYDKALVEPTFCEMYARFCVQLAVELPEFNEDGKNITFKRLLLDKCQEAFESGEREQKEAAKAEQKGGVKFMGEQREEKRSIARRRMLGNIRFIGELFKKSMLTERIMHECIKKLLGDHDCLVEENMEALCSLLTVIGHLIDHAKARIHVDSYFKFIHELSINQELSTRLKFMLKDLIELRGNGWQTRQKIEGPKTIIELHKEAAKDQKVCSARSKKPSRRKRKGSSESGIQGLVSSTPFQAPVGVSTTTHGEQILKQTSSGQDARMDPGFLYRCESLSLSDQGPVNYKLEDFCRETAAYRQTAIPEHCVSANDLDTRFATRKHTGVGPKAVSNCSIAPNAGMNNVKNTFSFEKKNSCWLHGPAERQVLERPLEHTTHASTHDRDRGAETLAGLGRFSPPVTSATLVSERTSVSGSDIRVNEQLEKKFDEIVSKYYSVRDVNEAAEYVGKLKASRFQSSMVSYWVLKLLEEEDDVKSELLAKLLVHLCWMEQPLLANEHLTQGCVLVFSLLENAIVNVPNALHIIARLLGRLVSYGIFSLSEVGKLLRVRGHGKLLETGETLNMLIVVLDTLRREKGETVMSELFKASKLAIEDFFIKDKKMLIALLKEKKLLCLYPMLEVENYIREALLGDEAISDILLWLQRNVSQLMSCDPQFLWMIMVQVLKHVMPSLATRNYKELQEKFKKYGPLLRRFSSGRTSTAKKNQQHYIAAVHDFVSQAGYPPTLTNVLYEHLYTVEVISERIYANTLDVGNNFCSQKYCSM